MAAIQVQEPVPFERFLGKLHVSENFNSIQLSRIKRIGDTFVVTGGRLLSKIGMITFAVEMLCSIVKMQQLISASRIDESVEFIPIFGFEYLMILRGLTAYRTQPQYVEILNKMYRIYPKTLLLQERMKISEYVREFEKRFNFLHRASTLAMINFFAVPLIKLFLTYQWDGSDLLDIYHMTASWLPFGLKDRLAFYPLVYLYEWFLTLNGVGMLMTWDRNYCVLVTQLRLQFEYLGERIRKFQGHWSTSPMKRSAYEREFRDCIDLFQHLNSLVDGVNDIFKLSILISDIMLAFSVCLHMYLIINTKDAMSLVIFLMPSVLQIWIMYDIPKQATQLKDVTDNITMLLFEHNWYDGSAEYRRCVLMWLQHASVPHKLTGYIFDVDMEHFQNNMMLSYQMLTFLRFVFI